MRTTSPPTLADVADLARVSRQTVSNALNNPDLLHPATLARVRHAVEELGYRPNRAARHLRTRSSGLVGLRLPPRTRATEATGDRFVHALTEACAEAGWHVLLFPGDHRDSLHGYDELIRSTAVDAFVVTDTYLGNPQAAWLTERGFPFVAFGRPWEPAAAHPWVDTDGAAGTRTATEHLLARGHTRIAWLGWDEDSRIGEDRRIGWATALAAAGIDAAGLAARADDTPEAGAAAAAALLDDVGPSAIVCASDTLATGVLRVLAGRGLRAGEQVAVIGFDDSPVAPLLDPGLTSVRQPLERAAAEIVAALGDLLGSPRVVREGRLLAPELIVRGSG